MPEETIEIEEIKPEKPKKRAKKIPVLVIKRQGESVLVEWVDGGIINRVYLPRDIVSADGKVDDDLLSEGAPYGAPWEKVQFPEITSDELAHALRRSGIWTVEDLRIKPNVAISAIQSIYRIDLGALLAFSKSLGKEE